MHPSRTFRREYVHLELTDGRILSVPLRWIPTLYNASAEEREKYELDRGRTMLVWDPEKCAINDEMRIADYWGLFPLARERLRGDGKEAKG